jgi:hypothetical protein
MNQLTDTTSKYNIHESIVTFTPTCFNPTIMIKGACYTGILSTVSFVILTAMAMKGSTISWAVTLYSLVQCELLPDYMALCSMR